MKKYIFPIVLYNNRLFSREFSLTDYALLRRISSKEREKYLGIVSIQWCKSPDNSLGWISAYEWNSKKSSPSLPNPVFDCFARNLICSEYVVELNCENKEAANNINFCFSLLYPTSSGLYVGFKDNLTIRPIKHNPFNGKFDYAKWTKSDLETISDIYKQLIKVLPKDKKIIYQIADLYLLAISSEVNLEISFLLLTTCLEMLFLRNNNSEITFKLAAYIASALDKNKKVLLQRNLYAFKQISAFGLFKKVNDIYKIRSKIIHTGNSDSKSAFSHFGMLTEIVRCAILLFIYQPDIFETENLQQCLFNGK